MAGTGRDAAFPAAFSPPNPSLDCRAFPKVIWPPLVSGSPVSVKHPGRICLFGILKFPLCFRFDYFRKHNRSSSVLPGNGIPLILRPLKRLVGLPPRISSQPVADVRTPAETPDESMENGMPPGSATVLTSCPRSEKNTSVSEKMQSHFQVFSRFFQGQAGMRFQTTPE